jgi:hypothetical protein
MCQEARHMTAVLEETESSWLHKVNNAVLMKRE